MKREMVKVSKKRGRGGSGGTLYGRGEGDVGTVSTRLTRSRTRLEEWTNQHEDHGRAGIPDVG